mmetsp:Transcript_26302/g.25132  ORF Transcript_26302/g.25132 Transcript_26302/m.25132 type:complete len:269 (-) Transcript_26302:301-1107(-)
MKKRIKIMKWRRGEAGNVKMTMTIDEIDQGIGVRVMIAQIGIEIEMAEGIGIEMGEGMRGIERGKEMIEVAVVKDIAVEMVIGIKIATEIVVVRGMVIGIKKATEIGIGIGMATATEIGIDQEIGIERGKKEAEVTAKEIEREVGTERSRTDGKGATLKNIVIEQTRTRRKVAAAERKEETKKTILILIVMKIQIVIEKVKIEKAGKRGHPLDILTIEEMIIEVKKLIEMVIKIERGLGREVERGTGAGIKIQVIMKKNPRPKDKEKG